MCFGDFPCYFLSGVKKSPYCVSLCYICSSRPRLRITGCSALLTHSASAAAGSRLSKLPCPVNSYHSTYVYATTSTSQLIAHPQSQLQYLSRAGLRDIDPPQPYNCKVIEGGKILKKLDMIVGCRRCICWVSGYLFDNYSSSKLSARTVL